MSESLDGVSVAATRQNAGRSVIARRVPPARPVTENAPAATGCAIVIVVFGSARAATLSHVAAIAMAGNATAPASIRVMAATFFIVSLLKWAAVSRPPESRAKGPRDSD